MTNKEKAFLIVEIMDLLDRWDKFREENTVNFLATKSKKCWNALLNIRKSVRKFAPKKNLLF